MPTYDKKRKSWIGRFRHEGKSYWKRGFHKKIEAKNWEHDRRVELEAKHDHKNTLLSGIIEQYLNEHSKEHDAQTTHNQKKFVLNAFLYFTGDKPAHNVITNEVQRYLLARKKANENDHDYTENYAHLVRKSGSDGGTIANRDLRIINAMFNWGCKQGLLINNPCSGVSRNASKEKPRYVPPPVDVIKVRSSASGFESDLIETIYYTGARLSEVLNLKWEDINWEHKHLVLFTRKRRYGNYDFNVLPITPTLMSILQRRYMHRDKDTLVFQNRFRGGHFTNADVRFTMKRLCKKAGVKPFGFHAIRHHIAGELLRNRMRLSDIQYFLRHKQKTTTETYLKSLAPNFDELAQMLEHIGSHGTKSIHIYRS